MKNVILLISLISMILLVSACGETKYTGINKPYIVLKSEEYENQEVVDPYELTYSGEIIEAITQKVDEIEKTRKESILKEAESNPDFDYSSLKNNRYDLIFLNDDNIPELLISQEDSFVGLYIYDGKKYVFAMEDKAKELGGWAYGTVDNQSYEYIPKANVVYNAGTEYKSFVNYYNYYTLNDNKLVPIYSNKLNVLHFIDENKNKVPDEGEKYKPELKVFYFGDKELKEEEFDKYMITGEYSNFYGGKNLEEFKYTIESLAN